VARSASMSVARRRIGLVEIGCGAAVDMQVRVVGRGITSHC
jgi:hypothetical protein